MTGGKQRTEGGWQKAEECRMLNKGLTHGGGGKSPKRGFKRRFFINIAIGTDALFYERAVFAPKQWCVSRQEGYNGRTIMDISKAIDYWYSAKGGDI